MYHKKSQSENVRRSTLRQTRIPFTHKCNGLESVNHSVRPIPNASKKTFAISEEKEEHKMLKKIFTTQKSCLLTKARSRESHQRKRSAKKKNEGNMKSWQSLKFFEWFFPFIFIGFFSSALALRFCISRHRLFEQMKEWQQAKSTATNTKKYKINCKTRTSMVSSLFPQFHFVSKSSSTRFFFYVFCSSLSQFYFCNG